MSSLTHFIKENTKSYYQIITGVCCTSGLGGLLAGIYGLTVNLPFQYTVTAFLIFVIFGANLLITHFCRPIFSKYFYSLITPIWICVGILLLGGGFAEGAAAIANLAFIFVFFRDKPKTRILLVLYGITIISLSMLIRDFYPPMFERINYPIDDILVMMLSTIWLLMVFNIYSYENEQLILGFKQKNEELEITTKELEEFTYIASHDLKVPLRNVNSFLNLIQKKINQKEYDDIDEYLAFAQEGSNQMYALVTNILEVSNFSNDLKKNRQKIDLNTVFNQTKKLLLRQYPNASITSNTLSPFYCNQAEMEGLFQNLIHNGLKYNESNQPSVNIVSILTPIHLQITFTDNGIGIAEEYHEQIFSYFKRLHNNTDYEGTGLGLGLCKKIVDSYNGSIEVQSSLGKGSTFIVRLPIV